MRATGFIGVLLTAATAATLPAQQPRITVAPLAGYGSRTALFDHGTSVTSTSPTTATYRDVERLTLGNAATYGALVTVRVGGPWRVYGRVSTSDASWAHHERSEVEEANGDVLLMSETNMWGSGRVTAFELGAVRQLLLRSGRQELEFGVGGSFNRIRVGDRAYDCPPPSAGLPCWVPQKWMATYDVPGVAGTVGVLHHVTRRVGLRAAMSATAARANTTRFWTDLVPEYDHLEAPRSRWMGMLEITGGLAIGF